MSSTYLLECTDCEFQTTVTGEYSAVVDAVAAHRDAADAASSEHFVNVHRTESSSRDE